MYLEDIYETLDYRLEETAPAALRPRHQTAAKRHAKAIKNSDKGAVTSGCAFRPQAIWQRLSGSVPHYPVCWG
jgi:hypothetical protein